MRKFICLFAICALTFSFHTIAENTSISSKVSKVKNEIRFPDEVPFFDEDTKKHYISDYEGKTLLVVFWATWCAPCYQEMMDLDILKKDFRKIPLEILPISQDFQGIDIIKKYYHTNEIVNLPILHDYKNELFRELKVAGLPTAYIVDAEGYIKVIIKGALNWHEEETRNMLLEYIDGNYPAPKNSYKAGSLNQSVKNPKSDPNNQNNKDKENE